MIEFFNRIALPRFRAAVGAVLAGVIASSAALASAGSVTTFASGMDSIFLQTSFGSNTIDIRFNPMLTVVSASLLSLDNDQEFNSLSALRGGLADNIVSVFFIDAIPYCGSQGTNIIGCGSKPGNMIALDSSAAARTDYGANLLAHELGHNLGLDHVGGSNDNLMNGTINFFSSSTGSFLDSTQVARIFEVDSSPGSPLKNQIIQHDSSGYFISITPYAVVASVPEPQTWLMMGVGLFGIMVWVRRPRSLAWRT